MTKAVNRERILKALERSQALKLKATEVSGKVIHSMATLGLKSTFGCSTELDHRKTQLELNLCEVPKDPATIQLLIADFGHQITRWNDRQGWIYDIQREHDISGLVESSTKLGDRTIQHPWTDNLLALVESDLDVLNRYKPILFEAWVDHAVINGLDFYQRKDGEWEITDLLCLSACLPFYSWAKAWEDASYTSPSLMQKQGFDYARSSPKYADDEKRWEVHLVLGNGLYVDDPDGSIWFCACNRYPSN